MPQSKRTKREQREIASKGGKKSGEVRRERARLRKLGYTDVESFDKLNELQKLAIASRNVNAAIKAEELKGKLAGLYVDKTEITGRGGKDLLPPVDLSGLSDDKLLLWLNVLTKRLTDDVRITQHDILNELARRDFKYFVKQTHKGYFSQNSA